MLRTSIPIETINLFYIAELAIYSEKSTIEHLLVIIKVG